TLRVAHEKENALRELRQRGLALTAEQSFGAIRNGDQSLVDLCVEDRARKETLHWSIAHLRTSSLSPVSRKRSPADVATIDGLQGNLTSLPRLLTADGGAHSHVFK